MLIIKRGRNTSYRLLCATVNNNKKIKRYFCKDPDIQYLLIKESFKTVLFWETTKADTTSYKSIAVKQLYFL